MARFDALRDLAVSDRLGSLYGDTQSRVDQNLGLDEHIDDLVWEWSNGAFEIPNHLGADQIEDWMIGQAVLRSLKLKEMTSA